MIAKVSQSELDRHEVVSQQAWIEASKELLVREKELSRLRDALAKQRRELPWVKIEKEYVFEGPNGQETFAGLFDGRSQLIVYHFMSLPDWTKPCHGCSFISDHIDGCNLHLPHNDVTLVVVSRAPYADFKNYKERMGWKFKWVSSSDCEFNYDMGVSYKRADLDSGPVLHNFALQKMNGEEQPGLSVFYKSPSGDIFHTYSTYERGLDLLIGAHNFLDLTPKGRNEDSPMDWVHRHDEYK
jgi:predicted dithiol-disulfide oxidoreductase (DUF899 family)